MLKLHNLFYIYAQIIEPRYLSKNWLLATKLQARGASAKAPARPNPSINDHHRPSQPPCPKNNSSSTQGKTTWFRENPIKDNLVLFSILLLSGLRKVISFSFLGLLGPDTPKPGDGTSLTHTVEGLELLEVVCQLHSALPLNHLFNRHDLADHLGGLLHILFGSVSLAGLLGVDGEEDELGLVLLQPLYVPLQGFQGFVLATVVNADTDGLSL